jgi:hypothetical protein
MGQMQNFGTGPDADEETKRGQQMIFQGEKMIAQNEKMLKQIRFAISIAILALAVGVIGLIGLIAAFVLTMSRDRADLKLRLFKPPLAAERHEIECRLAAVGLAYRSSSEGSAEGVQSFGMPC